MAIEIPVLVDSRYRAFADLSAKQFYFVKLTANGIELCAAATDKPWGVLQNDPTAGQPAEVMRIGVTKLISGGTIPISSAIGTDANGKAAAKVLGTDTTNFVAGVNDEAAVASDIFTAAVNCINIGRAA
jgi:hypothetical protein